MSRGRALGAGRMERRGDQWILVYTDEHGKRRRVSLSTDRRTAERLRADVVRKRDLAVSGLATEAGQEMLVAELVQRYLADLQPRATPLHHKNVTARLGRIVAALDGLRVADLKPMHVIRLRAMAQTGGAANRTSNLIVSTFQAALKWGVLNELIGRNPVAHVKPLPYTRADFKYKRRALSEAELTRFLAAVQDDDEDNDVRMEGMQRVPQLPLFVTLVTCGLRWNEARLLAWKDLDLKRRILVVRAENAKARRERSIPISEDLAARLMQLKMLQETVLGRLPASSERVFLSPEGCPWPLPTTNIGRVLHRLLERAKIQRIDTEGRRIDLHALRTTAASRLARSNVPLVKTQKILGHADPRTTSQVYVALEVEDLRDAVEALPPLARVKEAK